MHLGGNKQKWILVSLLATVILSSFFVFIRPVTAAPVPPVSQIEPVPGQYTESVKETGEAAKKIAAAATSSTSNAVAEAIVWVLSHVINFLLKVIALFSHLIIWIANYNNFVKEDAITKAWQIVRDIANMFFVVVFLVIAIGTILGQAQYHYKKALPRLLLMAVLINFSRTICGVIIDFAQVVMLTFVHAFSETASGNFIKGLGLNSVWTPTENLEAISQFFQLIFGYFLAFFVVVVAFIVMLVMTVVLLFRIIMLWLLIVISPLAFFAWAVPSQTFSKYFNQWWDEFTKNVISGPLLAFFLWLALTIMAKGSEGNVEHIVGEMQRGYSAGETEALGTLSFATGTLAVGATDIGKEENILKYLISLGMLIGGLIMTKQLGVIGSGMAGDALNTMQKKATSYAKRAALYAPRRLDARYGLREKAWTAASVVPFLKTTALAKAGEHRRRRFVEASKRVAGLKDMDTAKLATLVRSREFRVMNTPMERAEVMRELLGRFDYESIVPPSEQTRHLKLFEADAKNSGVSDLGKAAYDAKLANPHRLGSLEEMKKNLDGVPIGDIVSKLSPKALKNPLTLDYLSGRIGEMDQFDQAKFLSKIPENVIFDKDEEGHVIGVNSKIQKFAEDIVAEKKSPDEFNAFVKQMPPTFREILKDAYARQSGMLDKDPRSIKDDAELQKHVQDLGAKVVNMSDDALKDKRVVGKMTDAQLGELVKANKLQVDSIDASRLMANNGALAGVIAQQGSPALINEVATKLGPNFSVALDSYFKSIKNTADDTPENRAKVRTARLIASGDIEKSYDYDKGRDRFRTFEGRGDFVKSLEDPKQQMNIVSKLDVKVISRNDYNNELASATAQYINTSTLEGMLKQGLDSNLRKAIKEAILSEAKRLPTDKGLQDKARYVKRAVGFREI